MAKKREGGGNGMTAPDVCGLCHANDTQVRLRHWYNQFSPSTLRIHLTQQQLDIQEIDRLERWWRQCADEVDARRALAAWPEYLPTDEIDPDAAEERAKKRRWSTLARECTTPEQVEALAAECLSSLTQAQVAEELKLWRARR